MTQTAIEWLISNIESNINPKLTQKELIERVKQAKEMEKQQIIDSFNEGQNNIDNDGCIIDENGAEDYYNETFINK